MSIITHTGLKAKFREIGLKLIIKLIRKFYPTCISAVASKDTGEILFYRWQWSASVED